MLSCNSALVAIASEFTGQYAPYQSIQLTPAPNGGLWITSTDKGNVACLAFDPSGSSDRAYNILPNSELVRASRGVKTASRTLTLEGSTAKVITYRKTTSETKEMPFSESSSDLPDLPSAIRNCIARWEATDAKTATAGRYSVSYVQRAIKGLSSISSSVTLHSFDGGPMRIQEETGDIVILVMPQTAEPIPSIPDWIYKYSQLKPQI